MINRPLTKPQRVLLQGYSHSDKPRRHEGSQCRVAGNLVKRGYLTEKVVGVAWTKGWYLEWYITDSGRELLKELADLDNS